jgi:hypothetical protein
VWYTTLDLKDAFFNIPLSEISQLLFAFEWQEDGGQSGQLTWTRLPQGFKHSPTLFNEALSQDWNTFAGATRESLYYSMLMIYC